MDKSIILDRDGDIDSLPEYRKIRTEVDFLRYADSSEALLIQGEYLCTWAKTYYSGREIPYDERRSPISELMDACPGATRAEARKLYNHLKDVYWQLPQPVTAQEILKHLYPLRLWSDSPSFEHAARWLSWLIHEEVTEELLPTLRGMRQHWQRESQGAEAELYEPLNREEALRTTLGWLGVQGHARFRKFPPYPGVLSDVVQKEIEQIWRAELIESHGRAAQKIIRRSALPDDLKSLAASISVAYFERHPQDLADHLFQTLRPFLSAAQQERLRRYVPPPTPPLLPKEPQAILDWFEQSYLPYRLWQRSYGDPGSAKIAHERMKEFALWYLEAYPKALVGGPLVQHLSHIRASKLGDSGQDSYVTLVVVLDGLFLKDGKTVLDHLSKQTTRLTLANNELVFVSLPTVTEFCKDALFKGTTPANAQTHPPLGMILPERHSPVSTLQEARAGELYWWRVQEPDTTYHNQNSHDMLLQEIETRLQGISQKIHEIVNQVSHTVPLRIILTTDHGRLMSTSQRVLNLPPGMTSHGRAAWGGKGRSYPNRGYIIEDEIVYLHGERFGLPVDAAIPLSEAAFVTNDGRGGEEHYPHGGLSPEEVIVPWWVFLRDAVQPTLSVTLSGRHLAGSRGEAILTIVNPSEITIVAQSLQLMSAQSGSRELSFSIPCAPQYKTEETLSIDLWPNSHELENMTGTLICTMPNQSVFAVPATVQLESEEMYRSSNILNDLALP